MSSDIAGIPEKTPVKSINVKHITTPKSSIAKDYEFTSPKTSPVNLKNSVTPPKSSPIKSISSPNSKLNKTKQTVIIPKRFKSPSLSPNKCDEKTFNNKAESPKKKLNFSDEDKATIKTSSKRKISPTTTPENKKFKKNLVQSPDTQVRNIIF